MTLSLRNRFLLPTLLLICVGLGISTLVSFLNSRKAMEKVIAGEIRQIADTTTKQVSAWIHDCSRNLRIWSRDPLFGSACRMGADMARKVVSNQFKTLIQEYPLYEVLILADGAGQAIASSNDAVVGTLSIADRPSFGAALEGKATISEVLKSETSGGPVIHMTQPVYRGEEVVGAVLGIIDLNHFTSEFVDPVKIGEKGYVYVIDKSGLVIAHPNKNHILELDLSKEDFGRTILGQKTGEQTYQFEGVDKLSAFREEPQLGWIVVAAANEEELLAPVRRAGLMNLGIGLGILGIATLVILFVASSLVKPVSRYCDELGEAASQVADASGQVAATSQTLAHGTFEQSASLEESSASIEDIASVVRRNAASAGEARGLMDETSREVAEANGSVKELRSAMERVDQTSGETAKIINSIEGIAFRTNLLALNAAVEAARAGEAGAGFAVVANEVRNLAMHAAQAAKSTADLIGQNIRNIARGTELAKVTEEAFVRVQVRSGKVSDLIAEIAESSNVERQGIEQIKRAMGLVDNIAQQNAAASEELASMSEEMSAQACTMETIVHRLNGLVVGQTASDARAAQPSALD